MFLQDLDSFPVSRCKHIAQIFNVLQKYVEKHLTVSPHLQPTGTHTHKPATTKRLNIPTSYSTSILQKHTGKYIFSDSFLLLHIVNGERETKRKRGL